MWDRGVTGAGVDIALVDTGVVPVEGLRTPGKIVNGADVSFESGANNLRHLDTYGHGTHMAGIMAGLDSGVSPGGYDSHANFVGIAPGARVINVKVANAMGATDVSQVIAAIDWVVQHRNDNGMNIRVMNLSFGTDGVQDYTLDPLAFAAEVAWHKGIVVVVAAGNHGYGTKKLNNPAYDPYVIAVGAVESRGTVTSLDDRVPGWSSQGDGERNPDLVAPGKSIVSLRAPGSYVDQMSTPEGIVNERFIKGSGTSQAAAVVSGAAALLLDARPNLTPDEVKALLTSTARPIPASGQQAQGAGIIDPATAAVRLEPPSAVQTFPRAAGTGTIEGARGSAHVVIDGREIAGEIDVFGNSWSGNSWSGNSWSGNSWSGGAWSGNSWSGNSWSGGAWMGNSWSGNSWSGNSWSGNSWSGNSWSGNSWSGNSWSGNSWSGNSWSAGEWD
jgi:serine protease AprX